MKSAGYPVWPTTTSTTSGVICDVSKSSDDESSTASGLLTCATGCGCGIASTAATTGVATTVATPPVILLIYSII